MSAEVTATERLWVGTRAAAVVGGSAGLGWLAGESLSKRHRKSRGAANGALLGAMVGALAWTAATARPDPEQSPQLQVRFP